MKTTFGINREVSTQHIASLMRVTNQANQMSPPNISIEISASVVAWYAAIVSTFGLVITLYTTWKDRPRLGVTITPNMLVRNAPPYDPNKTYIDITVRNRGRRPTKISTVSLKLFRTKGYVLVSDSLFQHVNRVLTEESPRATFLVDQSLLDPATIEYAIIYDEAGNMHVKFHHRGARLRRFVSRWIRDLDYLDAPNPSSRSARAQRA